MKLCSLSLFVFLTILSSCGPNTDKSFQLVDNGTDLVYNNKNKEAKTMFEKALQLDSENYEAYYYLGNYYADKRNYKKAINYYDLAIKYNLHYADAYYNRGEAKFYLHDKKGACADWKLAKKNGKQNLEDKLKYCK